MTDNPPFYLNKYKELSQRPDYRFKLLVDSLEFENGVLDRLILFEDILSENRKHLRHLFKDVRDIDDMSLAFSELSDLPVQTIRENNLIFEKIFNYALNKKYKENSKTVINNITSLYDLKKAGLTAGFILDLINDTKLEISQKAKVIRTISEIEDSASIFKWDSQDLQTNNFIIPGYMYFYRNIDPVRSFKALLYLQSNNIKEILSHLYFPIEKVVFNLIITSNKVWDFYKIFEKIQFREIIEVIDDFIKTNRQIKAALEEEISPEEYVEYLSLESYKYKIEQIANG